MGIWARDVVVWWCLLLMVSVKAQNIEDKIRNDADLSEFLTLLSRSDVANFTLRYKGVTIFAPINEAFQKYGAVEDPNSIVLYHMTNIPKRTGDLTASDTSLNSELDGNPPLWITQIHGTYHNDIFVNNARVLISQSDVIATMHKDSNHPKEGRQQVLHKIDEVLVPTKSPKTVANPIYNPTAYDFLENYESLIVNNPHRVRNFRQKIQQHNKKDIYNAQGGHTFFIPVDEGFKNKRAAQIDEKVIDGHVIPNQVLFTAPTKKEVPFHTLADSDNNLRVIITFTQETRGGNTIINYVKSHTLLTDSTHSQGVVLSEIVKANIPVKNGVVHLIQKPLMVVDNNVKELLEEKDGGILNSFVNAINDADYKDFFNTLERSQEITLFAPCNAAWNEDFTLNNIIRDKERFKNILRMHLVTDNRLYMDKIVNSREKRVPTMDPRKSLYFDVAISGTNRTLTVEGGGVNATVIQADLAATNGIIHIIDRVLGVPYTTVADKLQWDPSLNYTYQLGLRSGINRRLANTSMRFTYFVPRNKAWEEAGVDHPSAIKKLFMPEFSYHATNILERHLVISDEVYTMERIKQMSYGSNGMGHCRPVELPSVRGELQLCVEEQHDHTFVLQWQGERIPVYKPNVACTNGVIHVIDVPFLQEGDVRVNGASSVNFAPHLIMIAVAKWLLL